MLIDQLLHEVRILLSIERIDFYLKERDDLFRLVHPPKTVEIESRTVELEEKGVKLRLTVVDTPGFGDNMNSTEWLVRFYDLYFCFKFVCFPLSWKPILDFIDQQFLKYFQAETSFGIERKYVQDERVHCCLYFLPPSIRGSIIID